MSSVTLSFLISLSICLTLVPLWIRACSKWNLFESGGERKHHVRKIPSMGGMAIFAAIVVSFPIFADCTGYPEVKFIMAAATALFFTGFFDDLLDISAIKKLFVQARSP